MVIFFFFLEKNNIIITRNYHPHLLFNEECLNEMKKNFALFSTFILRCHQTHIVRACYIVHYFLTLPTFHYFFY